jgi:hypothetical protein
LNNFLTFISEKIKTSFIFILQFKQNKSNKKLSKRTSEAGEHLILINVALIFNN